ncbi:hypothetical protein AFCA_004727 [Aspergillus flavus]|uniref:Hydrophobin family protein n=1 Tax=Aspergillus flavus TaxID=5059 RepID=A0AB74C2E0_ASPFL|nr:hydrophobin family protein [Aspergillus flavus]UDD57219.1 hypothetical protein AFCA_004727 [Aspergillus flavus]
MHSTNIFSFFMLAVAAASAATIIKAGDSKALQKVAEGKCDIGNTACCNNVHEEKDERLFNLVKQGLIDILAGNEDYACAKSGVIDERNLFSLVKQTNDGPVCKNVTACCPSGKCVAIDGSAKKKESDKEDDNEGDDKEGDNEDDNEDNDEDDNEDDNQKDKRGDHDDYYHKGHKVDKDDKENKHEKDEEDHGRY